MGRTYRFQVKRREYILGAQTWLIGVLNVTPDSFSDGGAYFSQDRATARGLELEAEGAAILDVGGESSRPGSEPVPAEEELKRVIPVISSLREKCKCLISIDTTKAEVAEAALEAGADIINDISSFRFDSKMLALAARSEAGLILMHMKGIPKTMQDRPTYVDLLAEVKSFLRDRLDVAEANGIKKDRIIVDPGIGFGKRLEDNLRLINNLPFFEDIERPLLVGISRKSFIGKILNSPPQDRLEGTIAAAVLSIARGASLLRVHDIQAVKKAVLVAEAILNEASGAISFEGNKDRYVH